jgi:phosphomethylpyrimidine synthase
MAQAISFAHHPAVARPASICSMGGPKFCSMRISQGIRDEAKAGMAQKAAEFRESGGDIYVADIGNF